ncbi:hypothetical protein [Oceanimonas baumannii]|uniref:hypothetical protein n=1 Tax=Oceanimonas baumannii TaxID=129578 RepID=UPI003A9352B7
MIQRNFMAALGLLDEAREASAETAFVPVVESLIKEERDAEAEIAAFVNRPDRAALVEASSSSHISNEAEAGAGKIRFQK